MDFMGKKLEDIIVTFPFQDGTSMECGVYSYFEVNNKRYFALLPLKGKKELYRIRYCSQVFLESVG